MLIYPLSKEERVETTPGTFADSHRRNSPAYQSFNLVPSHPANARNERNVVYGTQPACRRGDVIRYHQQNR
jgi:hypothetical protein